MQSLIKRLVGWILSPYRKRRARDQCREKKLIKKLYNNSPCNMPVDVPEIIYALDNRWERCGLADRLKGIVSCYAFAKAVDLPFKINHIFPFRFEEFLVPNKVNWILSDNEMTYCLKSAIPIVIMNRSKGDRIRGLPTNKQLHFYTNVNFIPMINDLYGTKYDFKTLFNELFNPSPLLIALAEDHLKGIGGKFISVSFRFIGMLGDFEDGRDYVLKEDDQMSLISKCRNSIEFLHKKYQIYPVIFVTADSQKFINNIKDIPYVYIIPGKIGHIGFCGQEEIQKTFLDFYMISQADKVFLVKDNMMYNSIFSRTAAESTGKYFEVIEIN